MPVIPALRRQRLEDQKLEASLDYIARLCLKKQRGKKLYVHVFIKAHTIL
jgi:hypothetical protein